MARTKAIREAAWAALIVATVALLALTPLGARLERETGLAWLYALRGPQPAPPGATVIGLDRASVGWMQRMVGRIETEIPALAHCLTGAARAELAVARNVNHLPRGLHACLVERLAEAGAALIVMDINFSLTRPEDPIFAAAIRRAGNVLLLESVRASPEAPGVIMRHSPAEPLLEAASRTVGFHVDGAPGEMTARYLSRFPRFPDLPVLPVEAHRRMSGAEPAPALAPLEPFWLYGPSFTVPTVLLRSVFDPAAGPMPALDGQVVLVGASSGRSGPIPDGFVVPHFSADGRAVGGVELAATAYLNLRHDQRLAHPGRGAMALLAGASALLFALALAFTGWRALAALAGLGAAWLGAAHAAFAGGLWLPVVLPLAGALPVMALIALERWIRVTRRLVRALAPSAYAAELLERGASGPRISRASVMFVDVAGSTTLAEREGVARFTDLTRDYYASVTEAVEAQAGMILEYRGDGMLALFPEGQAGPDFAAAACRAAERIKTARTRDPTDPERGPLRLRIGIATGEAAAGALTVGGRISITALGDTVNIAARLQELGKTLPDDVDDAGPVIVILDAATVQSARLGPDRARPFRQTVLRGRSAPTTAYNLR